MSTVALVPIKAHSERVSNKNFREFAGMPLCRWVLSTLSEIDQIEQIVVNTDARELLARHGVVDNHRVLIRERRAELRGDFVSMNLVLADDIANVSADTYLMTHVTNPLLGKDTIRRALDAFRAARSERRADSLFSVNRHQSRFYWPDGSAVNHDPKTLLRTQDLQPLLEENSNLYIFTRDSFAKTNARIGECPLQFETPRLESLDIDDHDTWLIAEAVARAKDSKSSMFPELLQNRSIPQCQFID